MSQDRQLDRSHDRARRFARSVARLLGAAVVLAFAWGSAPSAHGEEITGLQAAVAIEQAIEKAIERAEKSVVAIARVKWGGDEITNPQFERLQRFGQPPAAQAPLDPNSPDFVPNEFGTGVVIDARGLFLTAAHVVGNNEQHRHFITTVDRKVFEVRVKAADTKSDLAVLELLAADENPTPAVPPKFTPITFGDAKTLKKGQIVIALGNPYGIARDGQCSASWGIISNLSRKLVKLPPEPSPSLRSLHEFGTLIQTDAKLNFGTSGGALLNLRGEMIGLTTSLAARTGFEQAAGYAIPIDEAFLGIVNKLKEGGSVAFGFLGISPESVNVQSMPRWAINGEPLKHGVVATEVKRGTPAFLAGLQTGEIITHVNGQPLYDSDGLRLIIGLLPPGSEAQLSVVGPQQKPTIRRAILSKGPNHLPQVVTEPESLWRGLRVDYSTVFFPPVNLFDSPGPLVAISEVLPNTPAAKAGLYRQVVITHVEAVAVTSPAEFHREVARHTGPVKLSLLKESGLEAITVEVP